MILSQHVRFFTAAVRFGLVAELITACGDEPSGPPGVQSSTSSSPSSSSEGSSAGDSTSTTSGSETQPPSESTGAASSTGSEQLTNTDGDEESTMSPGSCQPGEVIACYLGPKGTRDVGPCRGGVRSCEAGEFGACEGSVTPSSERCGSGEDRDCDGRIAPACSGDVLWQNLIAGQRPVGGVMMERSDGTHIVIGSTQGLDLEPWPGHVEDVDDRARLFSTVFSEEGMGLETQFYGVTADPINLFVDDVFVLDAYVTPDDSALVFATAQGSMDFGNGPGPDDPWVLLRLSTEGDLDWVRQFSRGGGCRSRFAYSASDGGIFVHNCFDGDTTVPPFGLSPPLDPTETVSYIVKFDAFGDFVFATPVRIGSTVNSGAELISLSSGAIVLMSTSNGLGEWVLEEGSAVTADDLLAVLSPSGELETVEYSDGLHSFPFATQIQLVAGSDDTFWALREGASSVLSRLEHYSGDGVLLSSSTENEWPSELLSIAPGGEGNLLATFELEALTVFDAVSLAPTPANDRALLVMNTGSNPPVALGGLAIPGGRAKRASNGDILLSRSAFNAEDTDLGAGPPPPTSVANALQDLFVARIQGP